jgi:indole-3-glycerol phosphate synthase/phosphoribosylanthranilate isomerase
MNWGGVGARFIAPAGVGLSVHSGCVAPLPLGAINLAPTPHSISNVNNQTRGKAMFLDRIVTQTRLDLEERRQAVPLEEMRQRAATPPPPRDLLAFIKPVDTSIRLIAEVKRASPSKGLLAPDLDPVALARTYEANGAAMISVLTEPHFFLGKPEYLTAIKEAVRVPVLRKDFIIDEYQVYEARAWGADVILLICAILDEEQLRNLLAVSHSLGMHCLVEVHNADEARRAVNAGAMFIGVNSRDLATFSINPNLIRALRPLIPCDRVVVAESGIHSAADARRLARYDIQAMLVGESLVKAGDVPGQMQALLQGANESTQVKICGLRTDEHLNAAIEAGADLLGLVFYPPSHRYIRPEQVRALISQDTRKGMSLPYYHFSVTSSEATPDFVGVFVNEDAAFINDVTEQVGLQFVQLHGDESPEFCASIKRPVIKALRLQNDADTGLVNAYREAAWRVMLDTPTTQWGGTGETHDWQLAREIARTTPIILAGGLTPENVADAIRRVHPWGVDVSSGVETNKQKDAAKIRAFVEHVRKIIEHANTTTTHLSA